MDLSVPVCVVFMCVESVFQCFCVLGWCQCVVYVFVCDRVYCVCFSVCGCCVCVCARVCVPSVYGCKGHANASVMCWCRERSMFSMY